MDKAFLNTGFFTSAWPVRYWTGKPALVRATWPYDMWSVGVTWLELLLATPHVFAISERQRILLEQALHLDKQPQVGAPPTVHRLSITRAWEAWGCCTAAVLAYDSCDTDSEG